MTRQQAMARLREISEAQYVLVSHVEAAFAEMEAISSNAPRCYKRNSKHCERNSLTLELSVSGKQTSARGRLSYRTRR